MITAHFFFSKINAYLFTLSRSIYKIISSIRLLIKLLPSFTSLDKFANLIIYPKPEGSFQHFVINLCSAFMTQVHMTVLYQFIPSFFRKHLDCPAIVKPPNFFTVEYYNMFISFSFDLFFLILSFSSFLIPVSCIFCLKYQQLPILLVSCISFQIQTLKSFRLICLHLFTPALLQSSLFLTSANALCLFLFKVSFLLIHIQISSLPKIQHTFLFPIYHI